MVRKLTWHQEQGGACSLRSTGHRAQRSSLPLETAHHPGPGPAGRGLEPDSTRYPDRRGFLGSTPISVQLIALRWDPSHRIHSYNPARFLDHAGLSALAGWHPAGLPKSVSSASMGWEGLACSRCPLPHTVLVQGLLPVTISMRRASEALTSGKEEGGSSSHPEAGTLGGHCWRRLKPDTPQSAMAGPVSLWWP